VPDDCQGMPISPGPATNSGTTANLFEANRATDAEETGHLTTTVKGKNAGTTGNLFEQRAAEAGGVQH
jgi:hypothetical protein